MFLYCFRSGECNSLPEGSTLLCFCYKLCMAELRKQLPCVKNKLSIFVDLCGVVGSVSVVNALYGGELSLDPWVGYYVYILNSWKTCEAYMGY